MVDKPSVLKVFHDHFTVRAGASYTGAVSVGDDGLVSVDGHVLLRTPFSQLPIGFDRVAGDFDAHDKGLLTMKGCPNWVGGDFELQYNQLTSAEHTPAHIGGLTRFYQNQLTTLDGVPNTGYASFNCARNMLKTLVGGPAYMVGDFNCDRNQLTNLVGAPKTVTGWFTCEDNPLVSLEGMPTALAGIILDYADDLPLLRTLNAQQIQFNWPNSRNRQVAQILMKYAGEGKRGVIRCQKDLIAAGFEGNAKW
jgi:hypothetical protein